MIIKTISHFLSPKLLHPPRAGKTPDGTEFTTVYCNITNNHSKTAGIELRTHSWITEYKGQKADSGSLKGWMSYTLKGRCPGAGSSFLLCGWLLCGQWSNPRQLKLGEWTMDITNTGNTSQHEPLAVSITTLTDIDIKRQSFGNTVGIQRDILAHIHALTQ